VVQSSGQVELFLLRHTGHRVNTVFTVNTDDRL